jgi:hypothetical protein
MMQGHEGKADKWEVRVSSLPREYTVEEFTEDYADYIASELDKDWRDDLFSWSLKWIGSGLCFVGGLFLIFGPSTIMVSTFSGPNFFQIFQLYPAPIVSVGGIIFGVHKWILQSKVPMTPEAYLLHYYSVLGPDDTELNERVDVRHVGEDIFYISCI